MTEISITNNELNANELENACGGYRRLPEKEGFIVYKITAVDNLSLLARRFGCTVKDLVKWNPKITNPDLIYTDDYLYIRA